MKNRNLLFCCLLVCTGWGCGQKKDPQIEALQERVTQLEEDLARTRAELAELRTTQAAPAGKKIRKPNSRSKRSEETKPRGQFPSLLETLIPKEQRKTQEMPQKEARKLPWSPPGQSSQADAFGGQTARQFLEATGHYRRGNQSKAEALFNQIAQENPDHDLAPRAMYWQGRIALETGRAQEAIDVLEKILEKYPNAPRRPETLYALAQAHLKAGNMDQAREAVKRLLNQFPQSQAAAEARTLLQD